MIFNDSTNMIKASNEELKGKFVTFKDAGRIVVSDKYRYKNSDGTDGDYRKDLIFTVDLNGTERQIKMNTNSRKECHKAWGNDSEKWVGKQCILNFIPFGDGSKKMIYMDPVIEQQIFQGTKPSPFSKPTLSVDDIVWKE